MNTIKLILEEFIMTWQDLVRDQIGKLKKEMDKEIKKLNKINDNNSPNIFSRKVEIIANIKSITESIGELYILLGRENEVTK